MVSSDLIAAVRAAPERLDALSRIEFADLVAELLRGLGWDIQPIAHNFAGGVTFLGTSEPAPGIESTWVIECFSAAVTEVPAFTLDAIARTTRYMPGANALVVTTAALDRDAAQRLQETGNVQIAGRDTLRRWLRAYEPAAPRAEPRPRFLSCFLSYSQHDLDFASELHARLKEAGVRVWFAPEDLLPGDHLYPQVQAAIAGVDKLIVILSDQSIASSWVRSELRNAYKREVAENQRVLLPVRVVAFETLRPWEWFDADFGRDLAAAVRDYYIPDFSGWRDPDVFRRGFEQLLRALRAGDV